MAVTEKKYLDLEGLASLIAKLKAKRLLVEHSTTAAVAASAVKVGNDSSGHVVLGGALNLSDIGGVKNVKSGSSTVGLAGSGSVEFKTLNGTSLLGSGNITLEDLGITGAMHFKGAVDSLPTASTSDAYNNGDVILVGNKEYVRSGKSSTVAGSWVELGDESSYALKTVTIVAGTGLTGGGAISSTVTISHAAYDSASAAAVKVGRDSTGHVVLGAALTNSTTGAHTHAVNINSNKVVTSVSSTSAKYVWSIDKGTGNANVSKVLTGVSAASSKLVTTSIKGVSGSDTASKVTITTATITYGTANPGTAVSNIAKVTDQTTVIGNANVGGSTTVVTGFAASGVAYQASYTSASETLQLSPLTLSKAEVKSASAASRKITDWVSLQTITPAEASSSTFSNHTVSASNVTVPVAASAITVATGSLAADGAGATVATGVSSTSTNVLNENAGVAVSTTTGTGTTLVNNVSSSKDAVTGAGTSGSAGDHTHGIS